MAWLKEKLFVRNFNSPHMKNTFITLLFLGLIIITNDYANAQYNSDFEENTFNQYFNNNGNVYDLLNALNYNEALYAQGKRQIDAHIAFLKAKNIEQKSIKKEYRLFTRQLTINFSRNTKQKPSLTIFLKTDNIIVLQHLPCMLYYLMNLELIILFAKHRYTSI
jgi:hypothetical protein